MNEFLKTVPFLQEERLGEALSTIFPSIIFSHNKKIKESNINSRPDYFSNDLKLIVEFDGPLHYTNPLNIKKDEMKDNVYKNMGITIVRIPYFVQLSSIVIKNLFNKNIKWKQTYDHGFIYKDVITPAYFCELGIQRFLKDLETFSYIKSNILDSLKNKVILSKDIDLVIPKSLQYLLKL